MSIITQILILRSPILISKSLVAVISTMTHCLPSPQVLCSEYQKHWNAYHLVG